MSTHRKNSTLTATWPTKSKAVQSSKKVAGFVNNPRPNENNNYHRCCRSTHKALNRAHLFLIVFQDQKVQFNDQSIDLHK